MAVMDPLYYLEIRSSRTSYSRSAAKLGNMLWLNVDCVLPSAAMAAQLSELPVQGAARWSSQAGLEPLSPYWDRFGSRRCHSTVEFFVNGNAMQHLSLVRVHLREIEHVHLADWTAADIVGISM